MARPFSVAVYCSSSSHVAPVYFDAARELGMALASKGWRLVYGAGGIGLMGAVARACHEHGGSVYGVIPHVLDRVEVTYEECDELVRVETMRQRKALMEENADAFIALPGGFGTLEEIIEVIVLKQLRYLDRPIVFIDVDGYWHPLISLFDAMIEQKFARPVYAGIYHLVDSAHAAIDYIASYTPTEREEAVHIMGEEVRTALE